MKISSYFLFLNSLTSPTLLTKSNPRALYTSLLFAVDLANLG